MSKARENESITRRGLLATTVIGIGTILSPSLAWGNNLTASNKKEIPFDSLELNQVDEFTWQIINTVTGEIIIGVFANDKNTLHITYSDGSTSLITYLQDGSALCNGQLIIQAIPANLSTSLLAVPSGYKPLVTHRTHVSAYQNAYETILALIGIIPVAGNIVQALEALFHDHSLDNAYIEIKQYYHPNTYYIYTVVSYYRYSNYTGLLARYEYGPNKPV